MKEPKTTIIGCQYVGWNPKKNRRPRGVYKCAYDVHMPSGTTGKMLRIYEFLDKDIMEDILYTTPEIKEEMKQILDDCAPDCFEFCRFPNEDQDDNTNLDVLTQVEQAATEMVYGEEA